MPPRLSQRLPRAAISGAPTTIPTANAEVSDPAAARETPIPAAMSGTSPDSMNSDIPCAKTANASTYSTKGMKPAILTRIGKDGGRRAAPVAGSDGGSLSRLHGASCGGAWVRRESARPGAWRHCRGTARGTAIRWRAADADGAGQPPENRWLASGRLGAGHARTVTVRGAALHGFSGRPRTGRAVLGGRRGRRHGRRGVGRPEAGVQPSAGPVHRPPLLGARNLAMKAASRARACSRPVPS